VSGKCQLGKAFYGDSVLNGHSGVAKHAMDSGVSSSVGMMTESQNDSGGLSGTPAGLKLLHGNSRPDGIPITGDKVHRYANTVVLLFKILTSYDSILIMKANDMHYFADLFDKVLYMFRTCPLSIIRSISTLYTQ